jgi:hypothetical protein
MTADELKKYLFTYQNIYLKIQFYYIIKIFVYCPPLYNVESPLGMLFLRIFSSLCGYGPNGNYRTRLSEKMPEGGAQETYFIFTVADRIPVRPARSNEFSDLEFTLKKQKFDPL